MPREKTIKNHSDIQKKLYVYIPMIIDLHENIVLSYKEIQKELLNNFNCSVSLDDINLYFEPNLTEETLNTELLTNNLGIRYD